MKDFPLYRSVKSCLVGTLLVAAPLLLFSASRLLGMYTVSFILFFLPVAACTAGLCCGSLPMALGLAAGLAAMLRLAGGTGLLLGALYLVPIFGTFLFIVIKRVPFWKGCAAMVGVHLMAMIAVYALLQQMTGWQLYTAAGDAAMTWLKEWEMGDYMLYQLYSTGLIDLRDISQDSFFRMTDGTRQDLLLSVKALVTDQLEGLVPSVIVFQSIMGGCMCLLLPLRFGFICEEKRAFLREGGAPWKKDALDDETLLLTEEDEKEAEEAKEKETVPVDFPDLGMTPFNRWHVPRGKGWQLGVAMIAGYFLRASETPALRVAGVILYTASTCVFSIQGAATVNFLQKTKGTSRGWRIALPIILMIISVLTIIGIFDQINNIRGLRKPREPKEDF